MVLRGVSLAALLVALAVASGAGDTKPKRPSLKLRATPRVTVVPNRVLLTAELTGGEDGEALHCLTESWDWGDGSSSDQQEGDCEAYVPGTPVVRHFRADHEFRQESRPTVTLRLMKDGTEVARATVSLILQERAKNGLTFSKEHERQGTRPGLTP
jgi:hypothetical protein